MSVGNEDLSVPEWSLADRLRKSLDHAGITAGEMAQYLEVHRNTVGNWIYGHARPPVSAVKLWAMRCGVPYEWLAHGRTTAESADSHPDQAERSTKADLLSYTKQLKQAIPSNPNRRSRLWLIS